MEKEDLNLLRLKKAIFISENSKEEEILELLNPIINSNCMETTICQIFRRLLFFNKTTSESQGVLFDFIRWK